MTYKLLTQLTHDVCHVQGVIRIQCVAARELKKADIGMFGKGKSDPYLKLYGQ